MTRENDIDVIQFEVGNRLKKMQDSKAKNVITNDNKDDFDDNKIVRCASEGTAGDAEIFFALNNKRNRYVYDIGYWIHYTGNCWEKDIDASYVSININFVVDVYLKALNSIKTIAWSDLTDKGKIREEYKYPMDILEKRISALRGITARNNLVQYLRKSTDNLFIFDRETNKNPWLLPCGNGVIDLKTGNLMEGNPDDFALGSMSTIYKGINEPCPAFEKFMSEILDGDMELVEYMQRMLGHGLILEQIESVFLVLCGPKGRNGKDTLMKILCKVLEDKNIAPIKSTMLLEDSFSKSTSGPRPDEMELKGKRFAYASEIDDNKRFSQAAVKYYTGGNLVNARTLYDKGENKFILTHLLILLTNDLPKARGDDDAFWARLHLVNFNISFVPEPDANIKNQRKMDTNLLHKLEEERSGILSWLVRGCLEYQRQGGLHPPKSVTKAKDEYREHEDIIGQFIQLHCTTDKYDEVKSKDLYDHYMYWCKVNISAKYKMSTVKFADLMKKQGFEKKDDDSKGRFWMGLNLKDEIKNDYEQNK